MQITRSSGDIKLTYGFLGMNSYRSDCGNEMKIPTNETNLHQLFLHGLFKGITCASVRCEVIRGGCRVT